MQKKTASGAHQKNVPIEFPTAKRTAARSMLAALLPAPSTQSLRSSLLVRVVADYLSVGFAFLVTEKLLDTIRTTVVVRPPALNSSIAILYGVIFTLFGYSERLYHPDALRSPRKESKVITKGALWSTVLLAVAFVWSRDRSVVFLSGPLVSAVSIPTMLSWRALWRVLTGAQSKIPRNVLIIGGGKTARLLTRRLQKDPGRKVAVQRALHDSEAKVANGIFPLSDLPAILRRQFIDEVIIATHEVDIARYAIDEAKRNRIDLRIVPECFGQDTEAISLERCGNIPMLTLNEEQIPSIGLLCKRCLDVSAAVISLFVLSPILLSVAVAIKLDSPGPALYRAPRLGYKGRRFPCYKFRTMSVHADALKATLRKSNEREGPFFKIANDPRITRVGRSLRRYSLDELPQLWNVVRREMSLVGPRPHPLDDAERYSLEDWQRLDVMPGLTGLWQVTARHDPSFARSMELDREYIASWSLTLDFRILCKTVGVVLRGGGA